jgi:type II secretory pathway component PulF
MGVLTTFVLLAFVLPRLFGMLQGMMDILPLPTLILLQVSSFFQNYWPWVIAGGLAAVLASRWYFRSPAGALLLDRLKLNLPVLGPVFRASALGRFARTLGTLAHSGVSLLPALEIVQNTVGNRVVARSIAQVAEETRGGDSLASPLRKLGLFPPTMVQMIAVGEETGRLDAMLLRVASIQERLLRGRSRTLISLLAPALILVVGALVGFIVLALLLPIFKMSQGIQ